MRSMVFLSTTGGFFILFISVLPAQSVDSTGTTVKPQTTNSVVEEPDERSKHWLLRNAHVSGGQLTLPFKIRKSPENNTFLLTTDVTIGGYVGYTRKIAAKKEFYVTVPLTAGLTFININNNNTTFTLTETDAEVVPGLTWSTGIVFQLDKYSFGIMIGKDYASEVGDQWQYHGKLWWSFGIGFAFVQ